MSVEEFEKVKRRVEAWAKESIPGDYYDSSRRVYWNEALKAKVCTQEEYDHAEEWYGDLWTYTGD